MHALDLKLVVCERAGVGECGKLNLPKVFRMRLPPKTSRQDSMARLRAPLVLGHPFRIWPTKRARSTVLSLQARSSRCVLCWRQRPHRNLHHDSTI